MRRPRPTTAPPTFTPPIMTAPRPSTSTSTSSSTSSKSPPTQRWGTLVPSSHPQGYPAAEQMNVFIAQTVPKGSTTRAGKGTRCRPPTGRADCYVEVCPSGGRDVVMHPGF